MEKRVLLAVVLSIGVIIIFQWMYGPKKHTSLSYNKPNLHEKLASSGDKRTRSKFPVVDSGYKDKREEILIQTNKCDITLVNPGGAIKKLTVKQYKDEDKTHLNLIHKTFPLEVIFGESDSDLNYIVTKSNKKVSFYGSLKNGLDITKTYEFIDNKHYFAFNVYIKNKSKTNIEAPFILKWDRITAGKKKKRRYRRYKIVPTVFVDNKVYRDKKSNKHIGDIKWISLPERIITVTIIPKVKVPIAVVENEKTYMSIQLQTQKIKLAPNESYEASFTIYTGPKTFAELKSMNIGLEKMLHFGFFSGIGIWILLALNFFYKFTRNYGLSIIALTVLLKLLLWWPTKKGYTSMKKMQVVQPKIKEIQQKFKNNPQMLHQEMIKLYRQHKVNPLGGCWPMLIQLPVFFALYSVLYNAAELQNTKFLWLKDLSKMDPFYILPALMGISMFIQQKMTPTTGDKQQAKIMMFLPIIFTFMFLTLPAGVVLYWTCFNILGIIQQRGINKG